MKNLKKLFFVAAILTAFASISFAQSTPNPASDFLYDITRSGDGIKILKYVGKSNIVIIPEEIEGLPVTECASFYKVFIDKGSVLERADIEYSTIERLEFPATIEYDIFQETGDFRKLKYIKLPTITNQLKTFGDFPALEEVVLPAKLKKITGSFYNCPKLKSVNIPEGVKIIENSFQKSGITKITVPASTIEYINGDVQSVEEIEFLGTNIKHIEIVAYPNLKKIVFPATYKEGDGPGYRYFKLSGVPKLVEFVNVDTAVNACEECDCKLSDVTALPIAIRAKLVKGKKAPSDD